VLLVLLLAVDTGVAESLASDVPAQPALASATLWAVGDSAAPGSEPERVAQLIRRAPPTRFIYLGDVYPRGSTADFRDHYVPLYGWLARRTLPTPGNHEWPLHTQGYFPYWLGVRGRRLPSYYSVRLAGLRLFSLNSQLRGSAMRRQVRWVRRRLRRPGNCRIAFWHRPRFSAGMHGDAPDLQPLWRAVRGHVRLVLNGHDHDMQRLRRISRTTILIAGAGGAPRYALHRENPRLLWGADSVDGALKLRLRPGRARFAFVSAGGRTLHRGRVRCR
jgi:acid phosphatase type 7